MQRLKNATWKLSTFYLAISARTVKVGTFSIFQITLGLRYPKTWSPAGYVKTSVSQVYRSGSKQNGWSKSTAQENCLDFHVTSSYCSACFPSTHVYGLIGNFQDPLKKKEKSRPSLYRRKVDSCSEYMMIRGNPHPHPMERYAVVFYALYTALKKESGQSVQRCSDSCHQNRGNEV